MAVADTKNITIHKADGWVALPAKIFTNRSGYVLEFILYDGVPPESIYGHILQPSRGQSIEELTSGGLLYVRSPYGGITIAYNE